MKRINLSDISKQDPFVVPAGYFENLPQTIQKRVAKPASFWDNARRVLLIPGMQIAYAILAIVGIAAIFVLSNQENAVEPIMATTILKETSQQEIINYLDTGDHLSIQELALEGNWSNESFAVELVNNDVLEEEIMLNIDTYSAEELWK